MQLTLHRTINRGQFQLVVVLIGDKVTMAMLVSHSSQIVSIIDTFNNMCIDKLLDLILGSSIVVQQGLEASMDTWAAQGFICGSKDSDLQGRISNVDPWLDILP